jgi:CheY-like chemotaxis protein
MNIDH